MKKYNSSNFNFLLVAILLIATNRIFAQEDSVFFNSAWLQQNLKPESTPNMLYFIPGNQISGATIFEDHPSNFGLSSDYQMQLYKTETDGIGFIHYRFQQVYKGVKIEDAQFFVHEKDGNTHTASGIMLNSLTLNVIAGIDISDAFQYAANGDTTATLLSDVELIITRLSDTLSAIPANYTLAYRVEVQFQNDSRFAVYVNAANGIIFKKVSLVHNCEIGTCQTLYNGQQSVKTNYRGSFFNDYQLVDFCHGVGIHTYIDTNIDEPIDNDNNWSLLSERGATSSHWAAGLTWDYFYSAHGRSGTNNNNGGIDIFASVTDNNYKLNAGFTKQGGNNNHDKMFFGAGDGGVNSTDYATIDVVAHEFTHGVTAYSAALAYNNEAGALNESFSDIFGEMAEFYNNGSCDYIHGAEHTNNYFYKRSMINPNLNNTHLSTDWYGSADTYQGTYWYSGSEDAYGIHINCGVQNFWFYLLAEGGSGTNDNGQVYSVQGIGKTKAAAITFRSLTQYMGISSGYVEARSHSLISAEDLYGNCSNEAIQTANAWYAVGVGSVSPAFNRHICGNITGTVVNSAIDLLTAGTLGACSSTTVYSGANVVFKSANEIELLPGFTVESGSVFDAYIDPCAVTSRNITISDGTINNSSINNSKTEALLKNIVTIVPNPNNGNFRITVTKNDNAVVVKEIQVYDMMGKVIWENKTPLSNTFDVDISSYSQGIYYVRAVNELGDIEMTKLLKQ